MSVAEDIQRQAGPLRSEADLDPLMDRVGDASYVLLGEASHGTHEFYDWRAAITRRLISEKGFSFVGVEGDWPDCYGVNLSVIGSSEAPKDPADALAAFERWPTWMWANDDVVGFTRWLREHNQALPDAQRVGFFGLDVYSLWDSLYATLDYLHEHEPGNVDAAMAALDCFGPYAEDPQAYARATRLVPASCQDEVVAMLADLLPGRSPQGVASRDERFNAEQNAAVVAGAEAYYRAMVGGGSSSWNVRDRHMVETLDRLMTHHRGRADGRPVKAVVWEHNTHIGDARHTDMAVAGMVNVGQLVRERYGEQDVVLVGFGSHRGTVTAAGQWGARTETMTVPEARAGSTEALLHEALAEPAALFVFPDDLPDWLREARDHRAIGVVYHPDAERWGNYVQTVLGRRYDAFCWFDRTRALSPLRGTRVAAGEMETWPHGR
ncbi:Erythromycin esterase homolog [Promicromonospora umidemergens]|uniref:Erythromycin esterase-like protein n=1 Tax=Promicromonospora umidemergens TaxID=629679 RepID=A0ABP8XZH1_9MICO|nr:erythromycin esterase family protein [Promicromonospora umidemergens]MCP2284169.1 Erythromycin esterase homolog [Promicromonospora umidemergens]